MRFAALPEDPASLVCIREFTQNLFRSVNSGISLAEYLAESLELLVRYSKCDIARYVLVDGGKCYVGELKRGDPSTLNQEIIDLEETPDEAFSWTTAPGSRFEQSCRDLIVSESLDVPGVVTAGGSLCLENVQESPEYLPSDVNKVAVDRLRISRDTGSTLIVPVADTRKRVGLYQLESRDAGLFSRDNADAYERMLNLFGLTLELHSLRVALRERVKELSCLYGIVHQVAKADLSLNEILQNIVLLLPPGWLYPDDTAARISFDDMVVASPDFDRVVQRMTSDILVDDAVRGCIEVGYTSRKPRLDEGPFLKEERNLLNTIARELSFIIEQRTYLEERQRLQEQIRHADRLATIGQLAAGVAHELNEPLSNIMGFAQLIAKQEVGTEQTTRDLDKIVSAALHARKIIKELLVFARQMPTSKVKFNLNELIRDGLVLLEYRFARAGIDLKCELDPDLPDIHADRSQILQVLINLVVNSIQAMPDGGELKICTIFDSMWISLYIQDNGIGMKESTISKIFNPFFTTKEIDKGTGLGLSVVHGIIMSHGGKIEVDSQPEQGTKFTILIPID